MIKGRHLTCSRIFQPSSIIFSSVGWPCGRSSDHRLIACRTWGIRAILIIFAYKFQRVLLSLSRCVPFDISKNACSFSGLRLMCITKVWIRPNGPYFFHASRSALCNELGYSAKDTSSPRHHSLLATAAQRFRIDFATRGTSNAHKCALEFCER